MNKELTMPFLKVTLPQKLFTKESLLIYIETQLTSAEHELILLHPKAYLEFYYEHSEVITKTKDQYKNIEAKTGIVITERRSIQKVERTLAFRADFYKGKCININGYKYNQNDALMKITYELSDLNKDDTQKALNKYFSSPLNNRKSEKIELSDFHNKLSLFYIMRPLPTGVKGINYESFKDYQSNSCDIGGDIPEHIKERSLSHDLIDPHAIEIEYKYVIQALDYLKQKDIKSFVWLDVWYESDFKCENKLFQQMRDTFNYLKMGRKVDKDRARNCRDSALNALAKRIIIIQNEEKVKHI